MQKSLSHLSNEEEHRNTPVKVWNEAASLLPRRGYFDLQRHSINNVMLFTWEWGRALLLDSVQFLPIIQYAIKLAYQSLSRLYTHTHTHIQEYF